MQMFYDLIAGLQTSVDISFGTFCLQRKHHFSMTGQNFHLWVGFHLFVFNSIFYT